jgi:hypothetical protein
MASFDFNVTARSKTRLQKMILSHLKPEMGSRYTHCIIVPEEIKQQCRAYQNTKELKATRCSHNLPARCGGPDLNRRTPARRDPHSRAVDRAWLPPRNSSIETFNHLFEFPVTLYSLFFETCFTISSTILLKV